MSDSQQKFQQLLRQLFQFDCADLDFGVYRVMNYKRAVIERFITDDLPRGVSEELDKGALANQAQAARDLEAARKKVLETLGKDALDAEGKLPETFRNTVVGREYLAAQEQAKSAKGREALEASVYNHLYAFFSRYWQDGDFISKRRYSKKERYAIPYNGEEVYLYWANHDQYYVKTGEYFTDYTWKAPNGATVHFKLKAADVEQNNVKGDKRFFLPIWDEIAWDAEARTLTIPFEFRPLTAHEAVTYGQRNQQEAIITKALEEVPKHLPKGATEAAAALTAEKRRADGTSVTLLEHHLRQYTRRNTSDFFIHKDLKGFLSRELDFYLKNEVLNLDELEAAGESMAEGWFQLLRLIKKVGLNIIEFLAQIEDFQKLLWEKKKFVTETFYVITVGNIPERFYGEIAANDGQWEEWERMLRLDALPRDLLSGDPGTQDGRVDFLKAHPSLPLDTRRFPEEFVDRLLASYNHLDDDIDGLLVHSENWQALSLLQEKYRKRVKCIYTDPPYNTGNDEFIYRDHYQHSSWLSMMADRLALTNTLMTDDALVFVNVDDNEQSRLKTLLDSLFSPDNFVASIAWEKRFTRSNNAKTFASVKDWLLAYRKSGVASFFREPRTGKSDTGYSNPDNDPRGPWTSASYVNPASKAQRPNLVYAITNPFTGKQIEHPTNAWKYELTEHQRHVRENRLWWGLKGELTYPRLKVFLSEVKGLVPVDLWTYEETGTTDEASIELQHLFGKKVFDNPKPTRLVERCGKIQVNNTEVTAKLVMDFFAGSGTTGHAVINLNREDGGRRKFILVEMADYFDTVLLPRIKKVTFSPEWKDGQPKRAATQEEFARGPRIVKVIRQESYEDALNNLSFDEDSAQQALQFEDYLLKYMLKWETRHSETLLNVEKLTKPFDYCLHIHRDGETRAQKVDLPETFNYLIGLEVETRRVLDDAGRRYLVYRGVTREGQRTVVIWRDTEGWAEDDYKRDRDFAAQQNLTDGADLVYVNGDSLIPGARALEGVFKARMFADAEG